MFVVIRVQVQDFGVFAYVMWEAQPLSQREAMTLAEEWFPYDHVESASCEPLEAYLAAEGGILELIPV